MPVEEPVAIEEIAAENTNIDAQRDIIAPIVEIPNELVSISSEQVEVPTEQEIEQVSVQEPEQVSDQTDAEEIMATIESYKVTEQNPVITTEPIEQDINNQIDQQNIINDFSFPTKVEITPSEETQKIIISEKSPTRFCDNCGIMLTEYTSICPSCGEPID